ncbi:alpha-mannosidase [Bifidobacterium sp.]|uniref:alpha-mannosidase n=1 Tax=Bifidobacterium sp. TaxID=41200 RepID=UPI0039E8CFB6
MFLEENAICERIDHLVKDWVVPGRITESTAVSVSRWEAPGEPVTFKEAVAHEFEPTSVGDNWSFPWGTTWFHISGTIPAHWLHRADHANQRIELAIDLGFQGGGPGFQAEGTVYRPDGTVVKGIEPRNLNIPLEGELSDAAEHHVEFYVEAASNPDIASFGWTTPMPLGSRKTAGKEPIYRLRKAQLLSIDSEADGFVYDVMVLRGWADVLPERSTRKADIIHALSLAIDALDPDDVRGSVQAARKALKPALDSPAVASATNVYAVGHAHIDSAWLWPLRETRRKVARTFSNVLYLMDLDPQFTFAASSAVQYKWLLEDHPDIFQRIQKRVAEGRWVVVGGEWVEADANMIGSEAYIRQFSEGIAFFKKYFNVKPSIVWLPDSFGYSGALPGIARHVGMKWMLTQKLSWNDTNVFPHSSFWWEGIDGSRVFTHFPPADTYGATFSPEELARGESNFKELGSARSTMLLYGFGDGGGGPTRDMLELAHRQQNMEASPRVRLASPEAFFEQAEGEYPDAPTWVGELYLENHRGVLTSQHNMKAGNRRSEHMLREAEMWAATAAVREGNQYPYDELHDLWQTALLLQFHDILPGSAIEWVYEDATRMYADLMDRAQRIIDASLKALVGEGDLTLAVNPGAFTVDGVRAGEIGEARSESLDRVDIHDCDGDGWTIDNGILELHLSGSGMVDSLVDRRRARQLIPENESLGKLVIARDIPNQWDAWNIDDDYRRHEQVIDSCDSVSVTHDDSGAAVATITRHHGKSSYRQTICLAPHASQVGFTTAIEWHEKRKLLKLEFPLDLMTDFAQSEIQFGHLTRAIHTNTSWQKARFETMAQRWVRVEEGDFGVATANDQTYGHGIFRATGRKGPYTVIGESLLRGPEAPDPHADQGSFMMKTDLLVGADVEDAIEDGYRLNAPVHHLNGARTVAPLASIVDGNAVIEAIKLADDESGDVIVRLYESHGGRGTVQIQLDRAFMGADRCDALESSLSNDSSRPRQDSSNGSPKLLANEDHQIFLSMKPFQISTLRLRKEVE